MEQEGKKQKSIFNVIAIMSIIIFCFAISPISLQNDTFYTIKVGETIVKNGIDMKDHFSWNEDLPYTYPHWAYDAGIYLIYDTGNNFGNFLKNIDFIKEGANSQESNNLSNIIINTDFGMLFIYLSTVILACTLGILIYKIGAKLTKNKVISFLVTLGVMYLLKDFIAARAQLFSYILFALTVLFIENFLESKNKAYLVGLIIISIVLVNSHVAVWPFFFVLFLPYVAEFILTWFVDLHVVANLSIIIKKAKLWLLKQKTEYKEKVEEQTQKINDATNKLKKIKEKTQRLRETPYRIKVTKNKAVIWLVLVMLICIFTGLLTPLGDTPYTYFTKTMEGTTTNSINEHQPLTLFNDKQTMFVLTLFLLILIFTDTKIKLSDMFMLAGLVFMAFMSRRHVALLLIIGGFVFQKLIASLINRYDKNIYKNVEKYFSNGVIGNILVITISCIVSILIFSPKKNQKFINTSSYPQDAATYIIENLDMENMRLYNEYNYGSYLLFRGIPVFIDSRADLYAPEFNGVKNENGKYNGRNIFSDYINISTISTYYENKFEEYNITHVICVNNAKLNMFLSRNSDYKQLYKDNKFVIYERLTAEK